MRLAGDALDEEDVDDAPVRDLVDRQFVGRLAVRQAGYPVVHHNLIAQADEGRAAQAFCRSMRSERR